MSDDKLEFQLPPVPAEIGGLENRPHDEDPQDHSPQDRNPEDDQETSEPAGHDPLMPPSGPPSPTNFPEEPEPTTFMPPPDAPTTFQPPAYSDEKTFFPPPPAPVSQPPSAYPPSVPPSVPPSAPSPATSAPPQVAYPPSQAPPAAGPPATIDPLLQYREAPEEHPPLVSRRPPREPRNRSVRFWLQFAVVVGVVILAVVLLRVYAFESFYITSDSMTPNLNSGDRIIVNKLSSGRAGRGNVVVFSRPETDPTDSKEDLVKRVVALGGETITFSQGRIFIGSQLLLEPYLPEGVTTEVAIGNRLFDACVNQTSPASCTLAADHVYVLGDSRDSSFDSRFFGPIPKNSIVGRAMWRVWPLGDFGRL